MIFLHESNFYFRIYFGDDCSFYPIFSFSIAASDFNTIESDLIQVYFTVLMNSIRMKAFDFNFTGVNFTLFVGTAFVINFDKHRKL